MKAKRFDQSQNVLLVDTNALYSTPAGGATYSILKMGVDHKYSIDS